MISDLREIRELAGLRQARLAEIIGIAPDDVSRYEEDPDSAPYGVVRKWRRACGEDSAEDVPFSGDVGTPYRDLDAALRLLRQYLATSPALPAGTPVPLAARALMSHPAWVDRLRDRPVVVLAGKFDSGKTRIANALIGGHRLPSQYQPTTAISTFVRHVSLRPAWQPDDVWVMRRGFDPTAWADRRHCQDHRVAAGGFEILDRYGKVGSEGAAAGAVAALVYVDAPILEACTLADLPGFEDTGEQAAMAAAALQLGDVFVYTSIAKGFLGAQDLTQLGQLLRTSGRTGLGPLDNVIIVATHADPSISDAQLESEIFAQGAARLFRHLKDGVLKAAVQRGDVNEAALRDGMVSFWHESRARREALEWRLSHLLKDVIPPLVVARVGELISDVKRSGGEQIQAQIEAFERMRGDQRDAQRQLAALRDIEPERQQRVEELRAGVRVAIAQYRADDLSLLRDGIAPAFSAEGIEAFIRANFERENKADASANAAVKLLEDAQARIEARLQSQADDLKGRLDEFLRAYQEANANLGAGQPEPMPIPFDIRGHFYAGLAGLGTIGALGVWAASAGNLGGYVLVAKAVGVLAALGIGVNAAGATALVAAIGGPVVIAIGIAALLFVGIKALFGETWQRRLAKRISKRLARRGLIMELEQGINRYWDDTEAAVDKGTQAVERARAQYLDELERLARPEPGAARSSLEAAIARLRELQDFFGQLPWRSTG